MSLIMSMGVADNPAMLSNGGRSGAVGGGRVRASGHDNFRTLEGLGDSGGISVAEFLLELHKIVLFLFLHVVLKPGHDVLECSDVLVGHDLHGFDGLEAVFDILLTHESAQIQIVTRMKG